MNSKTPFIWLISPLEELSRVASLTPFRSQDVWMESEQFWFPSRGLLLYFQGTKTALQLHFVESDITFFCALTCVGNVTNVFRGYLRSAGARWCWNSDHFVEVLCLCMCEGTDMDVMSLLIKTLVLLLLGAFVIACNTPGPFWLPFNQQAAVSAGGSCTKRGEQGDLICWTRCYLDRLSSSTASWIL